MVLNIQPSKCKIIFGNRINDVSTIIITHPDRDHYNYLFQINFNAASIQNVIIGATLGSYNGNHQDNQRIVTWLTNFQNLDKLRLVSGGNSCTGNCVVNSGTNFCNNVNIKFTILAANVGDKPNEKSIVMKISSVVFTVLLPGDIEGPAASMIAAQLGQQMQSAVYKIAHHGASSLANKRDWLAPIQPTTAFASSTYNFGNCRHPCCDAICNLMPLGVTKISTNTTPHAFYCGNNPGNPVQRNDYPYSIYQTTPTANTMCLIIYTSDFCVSSNCNQIREVSVSVGASVGAGDDECPQEVGELEEVWQRMQTHEIYKDLDLHN